MLAARQITPELMDAPTLDAPAHTRALAALRRINRLSRTAASMLRPILTLARRLNTHELTLLDIACGGADVPIALATLARTHNLTLHLTLLDRSPTALQTAQANADYAKIPVQLLQTDAPTPQLPGPFDIITSSLFLHHLSAPETIALLSLMHKHAKYLILISDLQRSQAGLALAHLAARTLTRSRIVRHDAPASVRAAWTQKELAYLAATAGLTTASIRPAFPCRMLLQWERK